MSDNRNNTRRTRVIPGFGSGTDKGPDQAGELRRIVGKERIEKKRLLLRQRAYMRTIAVVSGKGGVGKSNLSLGLACALADRDKQVTVLDADLGLANLDILCGVHAPYNLSHVVNGSRSLSEVLLRLEDRVSLLPGGVGLSEMADLNDEGFEQVMNSLAELEARADLLILDVGAGIHKGVLSFVQASDVTLLITTPEPTSVRDAYGVIKSLGIGHEHDYGYVYEGELMLVVNMAKNEREALEVAERIRGAARQFLGSEPEYLGFVVKDENLVRTVRKRTIFYRLTPSSAASKCVAALADRLLGLEPGSLPVGRVRKNSGAKSGSGSVQKFRPFFMRLLKNFFTEK